MEYKLTTKIAPLIEPLGTVIYGQSLVDQVCEQNTIAIVGAGAIGLTHVLYAKNKGIKKIYLINNSREKLDWVIKNKILTPQECFLDTDDLAKKILKKTYGKGVDAVYLCTPRESAKKVLSKALRYVKENGCIDLVGGFKNGDQIKELPSLDLNSIRRSNVCGNPKPGFVKKEILQNGKTVFLTGHRGTSKNNLSNAIKLLNEKPMQFQKLITHTFSFDEAADFLNRYLENDLNKKGQSTYIKGALVLSARNPDR